MLHWIKHYLPTILDPRWSEEKGEDGARYYGRPFSVIISGAVELDGKRWIHFSAAHNDRIPTWDELVQLKEAFLGKESKAIQIIPPRSQYVNIDERVLHLWCCVDSDPLPDFTRGGKTL